ncbi:hypothetical protein COOONC_13842 [Cooperia oncophora]
MCSSKMQSNFLKAPESDCSAENWIPVFRKVPKARVAKRCDRNWFTETVDILKQLFDFKSSLFTTRYQCLKLEKNHSEDFLTYTGRVNVSRTRAQTAPPSLRSDLIRQYDITLTLRVLRTSNRTYGSNKTKDYDDSPANPTIIALPLSFIRAGKELDEDEEISTMRSISAAVVLVWPNEMPAAVHFNHAMHALERHLQCGRTACRKEGLL